MRNVNLVFLMACLWGCGGSDHHPAGAPEKADLLGGQAFSNDAADAGEAEDASTKPETAAGGDEGQPGEVNQVGTAGPAAEEEQGCTKEEIKAQEDQVAAIVGDHDADNSYRIRVKGAAGGIEVEYRDFYEMPYCSGSLPPEKEQKAAKEEIGNALSKEPLECLEGHSVLVEGKEEKEKYEMYGDITEACSETALHCVTIALDKSGKVAKIASAKYKACKLHGLPSAKDLGCFSKALKEANYPSLAGRRICPKKLMDAIE